MQMNPSDRFQGLLAFVRAVECGSFSLASQQMGLSPSSVGKAVARMEQRLGVRLFKRTTRRMSLTDEGIAFHESCLRALAELEHAESMLVERQLMPTGRVRIALPTLYGRVRVLPVLATLTERHPALNLDVMFSSRAVDLVEENVDLAVRIGPLNDSATHVARRLGSQPLWLCAAPSYIDRRGMPTRLNDLREHDCIALLRNGIGEDWQFRDGTSQARKLPRQARLRLGDLAAIRNLALAGRGLAQMPGWFVEDDMRAGRLAAVLPDEQPPPLPIHVLWPKATPLTSRLRATIDVLLEHLSDNGGLAPG